MRRRHRRLGDRPRAWSPGGGDSHFGGGLADVDLASIEPSDHFGTLWHARILRIGHSDGGGDGDDQDLGCGLKGCVVRVPIAGVGHNGFRLGTGLRRPAWHRWR